MTNFSNYETVDNNNSYGRYLHAAAKARGFYDFEGAETCQSIVHCHDSAKNRSLIVTAMCSELHDTLKEVETIPNADYDLALYRVRKFEKWYQLLFLDGNAPEMDPICIAIWDETEQVWHTRL